MNKKHYQVSIDNSKPTQISSEEIERLDVSRIDDTKMHILHDFRSYNAEIIDSDFDSKSYKVLVNNNEYNIHIFNDLDILIKEMGFEVGSSKMINEIKAPMPGLILDINIEVGQEVNEDDSLLILEAMKMENVLTSPRIGVVKSIGAKKGDAVEKNQILITFE
ncbi:MAG: acetyl-CoA carboxylase biotin carboxyl carrier protein subunit [Bacteroidia bacterium]|nr:acetyl-CoA carboxylase biotin carboxyl carrier protein subunit [Bacteroidia bacterium]MBT8310643.1 acetyl-CoA carboxylase biotin carboxyl carrier protein subunit [Bacteroidia bacterium]NNL62101.1 acetyl-CoA carboxylase biotin carboxyl carrier protein subunit [Flavobacteriaceae bacterium]